MRFASILIGLLIWTGCQSPTEVLRFEPVIHSISLERTIIYSGESVGVSASVSDADENDTLTFRWHASGGDFVNEKNNPTQWRAPNTVGDYTLTLVVTDGYYEVSKSTTIKVINR